MERVIHRSYYMSIMIIYHGIQDLFRICILRGFPITSISGINVQKCFLESDFLASYSGNPL